MTFTNPITGGQGALVRPAIKSPNYIPGVQGWSINRNGNAEFNDLVVRGVFMGQEFVINEFGMFLYSPTEGPGNLAASVTPAAGTDQYGNTYQAGFTSYTSAQYVQMWLNGISVQGTTFGDGPGGFSSFRSSLALASPTTSAIPTFAVLDLESGEANKGTGDATFKHARLDGDLWVADSVVKSVISGGNEVPETPHTPTYNSGWSANTSLNGLTVPALQYWLSAQDSVVFQGSVLCASSGSPGSSIVNLPPDYRPVANSAPFPAVMRTSAGVTSTVWLYLSAAGNININAQTGSAITLGATYSFPRTEIPLGHI